MENQEQQVTNEAPQQPELSINDLVNLRSIVDTAARRGAFQGAEMTAVGGVFDRLNNFLNAVQAKSEPQEQTEAPAEAPAQ